MSAWPDDDLHLALSDAVLCDHVTVIDDRRLERNELMSRKAYADMQTCGDPVGPRAAPAPCGPKPGGPSRETLAKIVPAGFLLDVCPVASFANQVTFDRTRVCSRSHQTFLNATKRGTGTLAGSNRGMTR
jgi:hypothetical protein